VSDDTALLSVAVHDLVTYALMRRFLRAYWWGYRGGSPTAVQA